MKEPWTRAERLTALGLLLTLLLVIAAFLAVPPFNQMVKLDAKSEQADASVSKADVLAPVMATSQQDAPAAALSDTGTSARETAISREAIQTDPSRATVEDLPTSNRESGTPAASDGGSAGGAKHVEMASPRPESKQEYIPEEDAETGRFRGHVTVCKFGIAPDQRQGSMYTFDRSPVCLKTESKVLRLKLDERVLNEPPVFFNGRQLGLRQLHVGDEIEAEMVGEGEMRTPILARIQLVKRASQ